MHTPEISSGARGPLSRLTGFRVALAVGFVWVALDAQAQDKQSAKLSVSVGAIGFAESVAVRDLPVTPSGPNTKSKEEEEEINAENREIIRHVNPNVKPSADQALSSSKAKTNRRTSAQPLALPTPAASFDGISQADTIAADSRQGYLPPDTNGAVGPNHYVQTVNSCFRVWDKAGNPLTATTSLGTLFSALGCGTGINGDPIVLYDQLADRWLISEFCTVANPNDHQLVAISKTNDPTGSYYLYDFPMPNNKFNDYPHLSVWPDGYYMTDNQFNQAGTTSQQTGVFAFNRLKMLTGDPAAGFVYFDTAVLFPPSTGNNGPDGISGMLPANLDGFVLPPAGAPCPFAFVQATEFGDPGDRIRIFDFHVDYTTPANSSFTERTGSPLSVAAFDPVTVPNSRNVIPQPSPAVAASYLDAINDRVMFRLAYRNFGTSESLVLNHTVNAAVNPSYRAGVRFYQLNRASPGAAFTIAEQQTFAGDGGDTSNRWMGSVAMNFQGDIALGYSVSSASVFPSIRYAAKLNTDPAGSGLAQGEQTLIAGAGSQTHTSGRWGDYSAMTVDPSDDCAFWYTQEYYAASSASSWRTRVTKVVVGTAAVSPRGTISGTITTCPNGLPIANAIVQISGGYWRATAANGAYSATVAPGTYTATVSAPGYGSVVSGNLVVSNGGTATFNTCLAGVPILTSDTDPVMADNCNSNGVIDPNETVTVSFGIKNTGSANTTNLVATLQGSGGVTNPSGSQTYGVVAAGGSTISKSFTFTAGNLACGSSLVATLALQDGATNFGTITYTFQLGTQGSVTTSTYSSGNTAVAIPDQGSVDIPITIGDTGTVADVNVSVRLNHTYDGDVTMSLVGPDNTTVPLVTNRGSSGDNFGTGNNDCSGTATVFDDSAATSISAGAAPFTGSFKPESPLSAFNGKNITGNWKLHVADTAALDTGTVGCVALQIARNHFVCCGVSGLPVIASGGAAAVAAENFVPANNAPDPGEFVTINLPVINTGEANTANLVGTLQATGGVTSPSGPQTYGIVTVGGPAVSRPFSFVASGTCGNNITFTLALQDGATSLGNVTYTLQLGTLSTTTFFSEAFDAVSAPALPAGWTTAATGGESGWVTSTTLPNSAPNDAFAPDVTTVGNTELVTPTIAAPANGGQLTFRNLYNLESGFDGMVLEISINGGAFADITAGSNSFIGGGYSGTISSSFNSPIAGRMAWTGLSSGTTGTPGYVVSTINLPAAAAGQNIKLKWRTATDNGTIASGAAGTRIDGISISSTANVCVSNQAPQILNGPPPSPVIVGTPYSFAFTASGNPSPSFSLSGALPPSIGFSAGGVLAGTATSGGTGSYPSIIVTASNGVAPNAMQTFSLTTATRASNYLAGAGLIGSDAVFTFDYDGDGLANLLEYALGLNPAVASRVGLPVVTLKDYSGTKYLSMLFNRSSLATDLTYIVQGSGDLTNWTDLGTSTAGGTTSGPGYVTETGAAPAFTVEVRDTVPYDPNTITRRFMRLKITSP